MRRRMVLSTIAVTLVAGVLALVGPAQAGGGCHMPATAEETASVHISKACFGPTVANVEVGQEVAFINKDPVTHNVVGLGARWGDPEDIKQGEMRRFTFDAPGVYPYACYLHYGMVGAVVVGGDDKSAGDVGAVGFVGSSDGGSGPGDGAATDQTSTTPAGASDESPWTAVTTVLLVALLLMGVAFLLSRTRSSAIR